MKKSTLFVIAAVAVMAASCCGGKEECANGTVNATDATINTIMQRKSVRTYTSDTIAADVMEKLLRAAVAAPSGMDVRPWHIVVMTDKSQYDKLFDTTVTRAPRENPNGPVETKPNSIWRDDMGACTENFLLAAEAYGLGAVWTACYPFHDRMDPVAAYLNLPGNIVPYSIVPVGYPAGDEQPKDKWNPERIHYNRW